MYRARVDAVSGLHVRAGGKWLTCIGNRVVRAGDLVWTDGRCVYGHDRESQTPLVIAPKEDLAVPLFFFNKIPMSAAQDITETTCTFFSQSKIKFGYQNTSSRSIFQNLFMINNKSECHFSDIGLVRSRDLMCATAAVNLDNAQDYYEIRKAYLDEARFIVTILKNNETVTEIDCTSKMKALETDAVSYARNSSGGSTKIPHDNWVIVYDPDSLHLFKRDDVLDIPDGAEGYVVVQPWNMLGPIPWEYYGIEAGKAYFDASKEGVVIRKGSFAYIGSLYPGRAENRPWYETLTAHSSVGTLDCGLPWAVIENENSWAFIFTALASAQASGYSLDGKSKVVGVNARRSFLYTPNGVSELAFSLVSNSSGDINQIQQTYPVADLIPIQNGFYFRINAVEIYWSAERPQSDSQNVAAMNVSVFNRDDEILWTGNISAGTYLTICKNKSYLLGVDNRGGFGLFDTDFNGTSSIYAKTSGVLGSGLYSIQGGQLEQILGGYLKNQKLCPMKRWQNWWERVQTID